MLNICTVNVRGWQNVLTRRASMNHLRDKKRSIYLLQETHCGKNQANLWKNEWGGQALFSESSTTSVGVGILINNNLQHEIHNKIIDENGRYIILDITIMDKRCTLANIYAPNNDNPDFFEKLKDILHEQNNPDVIIAGDFNLVLNPDLDKSGGLFC